MAIECDSFSGLANAFGFVLKSQISKYEFRQNHDGNTVFLTNDINYFPQYEISPTKDFTKDGTAPEYWRKVGLSTLLHEIGHALGALHEQAHPDAKKKLVAVGGEFEESGTNVTAFDANSIMFYCDEFRKKKSKKPGTVCKDLDDWPQALSPRDVEGFSKLYRNQIIARNSTQDIASRENALVGKSQPIGVKNNSIKNNTAATLPSRP